MNAPASVNVDDSLVGTQGRQGRVLGLDLGRRRVGLAISDSDRRVASPLAVMARGASHEEDHSRLAEALAENGANLVVVGLPLSLSGRTGG